MEGVLRLEGLLETPGEIALNDRLVALMDGHERPLFHFLAVLLGDEDAAIDCTQDTFVRAYRQLQQGREVSVGWLYTVGRNRAMDEFRRRRRVRVDEEKLARLPAITSGLDEAAALREAFGRLERDDREVLYLSAVAGFTGTEIAGLLGINPSAARMRLCRARDRFRLAYGACP